ncbi:MAG TPA: hypothetical protein VMU25_02925 [Candidatus Paceibacterota bacterium]|nr:hypothetical protein [Candidatus Paceibacterota bacterium]
MNGILTSENQANDDLGMLGGIFKSISGRSDVFFYNGYNPSHLDGVGDLLESAAQTFNQPITNYDRDTILMQIYPEVTTQKILLVGHSQGTFYTNEMYDYLIAHGVSPQSIAVYNLATPADHVEGGGTYLTSTNDKVIEYVRENNARLGVPEPLLANIIIPREPGWQMDDWGGHLPDIYLSGAPERIVHDIDAVLEKLSAQSTPTDSCFVPPSQTLGYKAQTAVFAVADPAARVVVPSVETTVNGVAFAASSISEGFAEVTNSLNMAIGKIFYSVFPEANVQNATAAFSVEKALYGSSLSPEEYQALLENSPLPGDTQPSSADVNQPQQPDAIQNQPPEEANVVTPVPSDSASTTQTPEAQPSQPQTPVPVAIANSPGFGGGAPISQNESNVQAASDQTATSTQADATTTEPTATSTIALAIVSPDDDVSFATTTIGFTGTTSPSATVFAQYGATSTSVQADAAGDWSFTFVLDAGTTTVSISAFDGSTTSATSTRTIGISQPAQATTTEVLAPITQTPCGNASLEAQGYFFSSDKDGAGYSSNGYLEDHFALLPAYQTGRAFKLFWNFYSDDCGTIGPIYDHPSLSISVPSGDVDWSIRFTSATHFDVWDDDANTILNSADIPALPSYASMAFGATIDGNASTLASRGLQIVQNGSAPIVQSTIAAADGCSAQNNSYLMDGSYERAEYVGGLLRLHLREQNTYNDGRGFYYLVQAGNDCTALNGLWWKSISTSAGLPAYERYFSIRMTSPTHWILWDDEQNTSLGAEGDIPDGSAYVRFYNVLDVNASYLSGAYAPTQ